MNVTLIQPYDRDFGRPQLYMSLLYLATALERAGHSVRVVDSQIEDPKKAIRETIGSCGCIGISAMTTQVRSALDISDYAKSLNPDVPVVWGGFHPTLYPEQTVMDRSVDYVIAGEGETGFAQLLSHLEGRMKIENVHNLVYEKRGRVFRNPEAAYVDLNSLSPPSWHLMDIGKYMTDFGIGGENLGKAMFVHSGRGCPFNCTFCINTVFRTKKWRPLSAENIINEIRLIKDMYKVRYIKFVDENFFLDRKRVADFCGRLLEERLDIRWHATCRASYFNDSHMDSGLLQLAKRSGCAVVAMGIESGSQRVLDMIKKGIKVQDAERAVSDCGRFGIIPICSFMVGMPGETKADMKMTVQLMKRLRKINRRTVIVGPQVFRPYPGCEMYDGIRGDLQEPESLRAWGDMKPFGEIYAASSLPWISNPGYVEALSFYSALANTSSPSMLGALFELPLKKLADFRVNHSFFRVKLDKAVYEAGKKVLAR